MGGLEAGHQHLTHGRRGRGTAGALIGEERAGNDARRAHRRVADEPGVGLLVGVGVLAPVAVAVF